MTAPATVSMIVRRSDEPTGTLPSVPDGLKDRIPHMRMSQALKPVLDRRRSKLFAEMSASIDDPEGHLFVGVPMQVVGAAADPKDGRAGREEEAHGPATFFNIGYASLMRTPQEAMSLLDHVRTFAPEGRSELSRMITARLLRFVDLRTSGPESRYRSAAREIRGNGNSRG